MGRSSLRTGFDVEAAGGGLKIKGCWHRVGTELAPSVDLSDRKFYLSRDRGRFTSKYSLSP